MRSALFIAGLFAVLLSLAGCDACKKMAKSKDLALKDSAAYCYYDKKQYESAALLLEELLGIYPPGEKSEKTLFYLANAKFFSGEMISASFLYNEFIQRYPSSRRAPDVHYQLAETHVNMSPSFYLDQGDTKKAIERLQLFIELYPQDERVPEATKTLDEMRDKLAEKMYTQADLYLKIYHFQSAVLYLQAVIQEYPDSRFREAAQYKLFKAQVYYADNSVAEKRLERYEEVQALYLKFIDKFPESKYIRPAESLYAGLDKKIRLVKAGDEESLKKETKNRRGRRRIDEEEKEKK
ncbi:MAG: outer membrane protein assembly factor BamD [Bacteroidetes bacterium]|jgi:outer membrane protein assembly factor BamD|nr:outer membrane protein assembly factor BamD [Bacteroidota bacterium]